MLGALSQNIFRCFIISFFALMLITCGDGNDTSFQSKPDTTPPVITLIGANPMTVVRDQAYVEPGATAIDNIDGDITDAIVIMGGVDSNTPGNYIVVYSVTDAANNSHSIERTVTVETETTPPIITLNGMNPMTLTQGQAYVEPGATATDNVDGDITDAIVITGSVDVHTPGNYFVNYSVTDAANNSQLAERMVVVEVESTPPVIVLNATNPMTLMQGKAYVEPGAVAIDNVDGNISGLIIISGSVDTNTPGSYIISYNVMDAANNFSTVGRTVIVLSSGPANESVPFNVGKISFTFDDGVESLYKYALPIFEARNVSATAYITTDWVETNGYMTWQEIQSLQNDHHWEIGSHALSHQELPLLSDNNINSELAESKGILVSKGLQVSSFASPFGSYDNRVLGPSSRVYTQHRGFWDRDDLNSFPYNNTVLMVKSVDRFTSNNEVFALIDRAKNEKKWLILVFHEVLPETIPNYIYTTLPGDLEKMVDYAVASGIEFVVPNHTAAFDTYNLMAKNNDTTDWTKGWTMDSQNIELAAMNSGQSPHITEAFLFKGEDNDINLYSAKINIDTSKNYRFKCFVDTLQLEEGEFGFYLNEYDQNDQRLAGENLGIVRGKKITEVLSSYKPQNSQTAYIIIQTYLSAGSVGQVISDHYQLYQLD